MKLHLCSSHCWNAIKCKKKSLNSKTSLKKNFEKCKSLQGYMASGKMKCTLSKKVFGTNSIDENSDLACHHCELGLQHINIFLKKERQKCVAKNRCNQFSMPHTWASAAGAKRAFVPAWKLGLRSKRFFNT